MTDLVTIHVMPFKEIMPSIPSRRYPLERLLFTLGALLQLYWVLVYFPSDTAMDPTAYCVSTDEADDVHPVDASWACEL